MDSVVLYITAAISAAALIISILVLSKLNRNGTDKSGSTAQLEQVIRDLASRQEGMRRELNDSIRLLSELLSSNQRASADAAAQKLGDMERALSSIQEATYRSTQSSLRQLEERLKTFSMENEQRLDNIRATVSRHLVGMQEDNNRRLDEMRGMVDEKLQRTLDERMTNSFRLVNERLEQVYKGLGEMQTLAIGVGDLKRVLSNVKTRGILGEIQLGAILEEILAPEQFDREVAIKRNTKVEFAIKLPGDNGDTVYLPVDSKFPVEAYQKLMDAYESADPALVKTSGAALCQALKVSAKDICTKYIDPPKTTSFAVMFLPTEGLYAESAKLGLIETLRREFNVCVAGPSTMAALLNSMQMGFRSYIIHKRGGEVWEVLSEVKTEFERFADGLNTAQERIEQVNKDLDTLVGVRTRQMRRKLQKITEHQMSDGDESAV